MSYSPRNSKHKASSDSLRKFRLGIRHHIKEYHLKTEKSRFEPILRKLGAELYAFLTYAYYLYQGLVRIVSIVTVQFVRSVFWLFETKQKAYVSVAALVFSIGTFLVMNSFFPETFVAEADKPLYQDQNVLVFNNYLRKHRVYWGSRSTRYGYRNYYVRSPQKIYSSKKYAILLFLHGSNGIGTDAAKPMASHNWLRGEGLEHHYRYTTDKEGRPKKGVKPLDLEDDEDSLIVIFPQSPTPPEWDAEDLFYLAKIMDDFREKYPISNFDFYLGGFSDGAYFSSRYFMEAKFRIAGLVVLGGGLYPGSVYVKEIVHHKFKEKAIPLRIPIFLGVGSDDGMTNWINFSRRVFNKMGNPIEYHLYPRKGHFVNADQVRDVKGWIQKHSGVKIVPGYEIDIKPYKPKHILIEESKGEVSGTTAAGTATGAIAAPPKN